MKKNNSHHGNRRTSQASKGGENKAYVRTMQGKRFSSAAGPHTPDTNYRRKPKHPGKGWE